MQPADSVASLHRSQGRPASASITKMLISQTAGVVAEDAVGGIVGDIFHYLPNLPVSSEDLKKNLGRRLREAIREAIHASMPLQSSKSVAGGSRGGAAAAAKSR